MIKAAVFDMDGILFDTERLSCDGWRAACREQGHEFTEEHVQLTLGLTDRDTANLLHRLYGADFDYPRAEARMYGYMKEYFQEFGAPVKRGLYELLDYLDSACIIAAIGSSSNVGRIIDSLTSADAHASDTARRLETSFRFISSGDDAAHGKPAPDIFLNAAEGLGVAPEDCIAFEDSASGLKAAKAAGMKTVMVPDLHMPDDTDRAGLFALIPSLDCAIALIKEANGQ